MAVAPGVFVPRPRSEALVAEAVALAPAGAVVVDLCCGSGAIGLAVVSRVDGAELHAADLDPAALDCARRNLTGIGEVYPGDLFAALPPSLRGRTDLIVANAPYVPTAELPLLPREARDHEPSHALDGGRDGLAVHRRIAPEARSWLAPAGHLLTETTPAQASAAAALFTDHGLLPQIHEDEDLEVAVVVASQPAI